VGGHFLTLSAIADRGQPLALARYYAEDTLSRAPGAVAAITSASQTLQDAASSLYLRA
jgi:hypothetical protein